MLFPSFLHNISLTCLRYSTDTPCLCIGPESRGIFSISPTHWFSIVHCTHVCHTTCKYDEWINICCLILTPFILCNLFFKWQWWTVMFWWILFTKFQCINLLRWSLLPGPFLLWFNVTGTNFLQTTFRKINLKKMNQHDQHDSAFRHELFFYQKIIEKPYKVLFQEQLRPIK